MYAEVHKDSDQEGHNNGPKSQQETVPSLPNRVPGGCFHNMSSRTATSLYISRYLSLIVKISAKKKKKFTSQRGSTLRPEPPFTGVSRTLRARNRKKISKKGLFGGPQKSLKKYPEKSKNTDFRTFLAIFRLFRVYFGTFLQAPKKTFFETFFLRFRVGVHQDYTHS